MSITGDLISILVLSVSARNKPEKVLQRWQNHVAAFIEYETMTEKKSLHLPVNITSNATNTCRV